ncbi:MAG: toluene hydroxylase, partial [Acidimicrobiia bacterium]
MPVITKDREHRRTRRLYWQPTYVDEETIFPSVAREGIHFKDWDSWDDPFHMSYRQYIDVQAKKEAGFHP